ncbi:DVUA0089 family protein [Flavobacterium enshiense]|uniref:DVUA0089 family protein n=1 Tax=Flavobacterium enshiense TaxID=1341165 RepID=UPI00138AC11D|nr:DVUA0089 family protein [Flavobacterium enshiense]
MSTEEWPESAVNSLNNGSVQEIDECNYAGEYATISGIIVGNNYEFASSGASGGYLTVTDQSNTVIASGVSPLTVNNITVSTVRLHIHTDAACGVDEECHVLSIQCVSPSCAPPVNDNCANAISIASFPYSNSQNALGATNNTGFVLNCEDGMNDGVWYTFTVATAGDVAISLTGVTGWDPELAVYSGSCGTFTCVGSKDDGYSGIDETLELTALAPGQYWVNIGQWDELEDGLEGPLTVSLSGTATLLGTAQFDATSFKAYPNPVRNVLNVSYSSEISSVEVYNMLGQKVLTKTLNIAQGQIDMSNLNAGNYIVKVTAEGLTKTIKVVKQ